MKPVKDGSWSVWNSLSAKSRIDLRSRNVGARIMEAGDVCAEIPDHFGDDSGGVHTGSIRIAQDVNGALVASWVEIADTPDSAVAHTVAWNDRGDVVLQEVGSRGNLEDAGLLADTEFQRARSRMSRHAEAALKLAAAYERNDHMSDDPRVSSEVSRLEESVHRMSDGYGSGLSPAEEALREYTTNAEREAADRAKEMRRQMEANRAPAKQMSLEDRIKAASSSTLRVTYGQLLGERFKSPSVLDRINKIEAELRGRGELV